MKSPYPARAAAALVVCIVAGCGLSPQVPYGVRASSSRQADRSDLRRTASPASGVIQHVVFIIQENRSFNDLFLGFKGATTQNYGYDLTGAKIKLTPISLATTWDLDHSAGAFFTDDNNGKNNGWAQESTGCGTSKYCPYAYVPRGQVKTYWNMAEQYVLSDRTFQSHLDGSFVSHEYAVAAYADHEVDFPSAAWGCVGGPYDVVPTLNADRSYGADQPVCEDFPTLGDLLDGVGVSWRHYSSSTANAPLWNGYASVSHIYNGPDWANMVTPSSQFLTDVGHGNLAGMTWITPSAHNSDHASSDSTSGPSWVASLVNAVGKSPFWNSTAIFIVWDDWGGWYDPVLPIYADYDGLGYRIPMIMISPYAKQGVVTHVQYEMTSVLRFAEDLWGTGQLAASDARAADPANDPAFDFTQAPRTFVPFASAPLDRFEAPASQPLSHRYGD